MSILTSLYNRILKVLALMPEESSYRRHTSEVVQSRLNAVNKIPDVPTLESTIDCGQIEEVIVQVKYILLWTTSAEYYLLYCLVVQCIIITLPFIFKQVNKFVFI
ncbi:unnamed protein product [Trichobilharzia regenti]|nr:unnamed protein product [Trichobilharzia regenti]